MFRIFIMTTLTVLAKNILIVSLEPLVVRVSDFGLTKVLESGSLVNVRPVFLEPMTELIYSDRFGTSLTIWLPSYWRHWRRL